MTGVQTCALPIWINWIKNKYSFVTIQVGTEGQRHIGTKKNENVYRFAGLAEINDFSY